MKTVCLQVYPYFQGPFLIVILNGFLLFKIVKLCILTK